MQFSTEAPVQRLSAFNANGVRVAQLDFPVPPRQIEPLYFQWREGETYRFEATLSTGGVDTETVTAPHVYTQGNLEIAIPYGAAQQSDMKNAVRKRAEGTRSGRQRNGGYGPCYKWECANDL